jgi:hypothetical protein
MFGSSRKETESAALWVQWTASTRVRGRQGQALGVKRVGESIWAFAAASASPCPPPLFPVAGTALASASAAAASCSSLPPLSHALRPPSPTRCDLRRTPFFSDPPWLLGVPKYSSLWHAHSSLFRGESPFRSCVPCGMSTTCSCSRQQFPFLLAATHPASERPSLIAGIICLVIIVLVHQLHHHSFIFSPERAFRDKKRVVEQLKFARCRHKTGRGTHH